MENPATWGKIRHVIAKTMSEHHRMVSEGYCGLSLPSMIYNALHNRGWLVEDSKDLEESYDVIKDEASVK